VKGNGIAPILGPIPEISCQEVRKSARKISHKTNSWSNDRDVKPGPAYIRTSSVLQSYAIRVEVGRLLRSCVQQEREIPDSNLIPAAGNPVRKICLSRRFNGNQRAEPPNRPTSPPPKIYLLTRDQPISPHHTLGPTYSRCRVPRIFLRGKDGRCVGLKTLQHSCADCLEIWKPQTPAILRACPGL
jgi:hypothetical protein